mgnify:CR=1 FL=1
MLEYYKVLRVEQQQICRGHPMYNVITDFCIRSKNFYNYALYYTRQEFINNGKWIRYQEMQKSLKDTEPYKQLMSQSSQCVLQVLDRNWKSFFNGMKSWKKDMHGFLGMPRLPNYKKKDGKFTWFLKNNQAYIKEGRLYFKLKAFNGYSFKTNVKDRLYAIRFVPQNDYYTLEIIYEKEIKNKETYNTNCVSIDLGVNNFVTMTNNVGLQPIVINGKGIKSINQYYNKQRLKLMGNLIHRNNQHWSHKLDTLNKKRYNRIKNFMHHDSRYIINYCIENNIDNLAIGLNKKWKQNCKLGDKTTQAFTFIPYETLIKQLQYKCDEHGIQCIVNEESYTSGTSFLDNEEPTKENYNKKRRIKRGLFKSNDGTLINSDVNGSLQIMKKVFPKALTDGIVGNLTPTIINVCKM